MSPLSGTIRLTSLTETVLPSLSCTETGSTGALSGWALAAAAVVAVGAGSGPASSPQAIARGIARMKSRARNRLTCFLLTNSWDKY
jgi:hypothetical protein